MPIPNLTDETPINQYTANSGETEFAFTFYIFALSDIKVYANDVLKTITTDYVVRKNDGNVIGDADLPMDGGKIIFNVGRAAGEKISLNRDIPVDRSTQFSTGGAFKADSLNSELTRILTIAQQLKRDVARSFRLAPSDAEGGSLQLPTDRADNILAFDSNSNLILTKFADIDKANVSPFIATLLDDVSASIARGTLNAQELNANLTSFANLNGSANKSFYFDGAGSLVLADRLGTTTTQGVAFLSNPITISNNATDANNDIDFSAGNAPLDDGSGQILLASTLVKRLDASWSAGTNQGGLFSGTKATNTWYYLFAIVNTTTGATDAGFDSSVSGANVPSGWKISKILHAIKTDGTGSGNILQGKFYSDGWFYYNSEQQEYTSTSTTAGTFINLSFAPKDIISKAYFTALATNNGTSGNRDFRVGISSTNSKIIGGQVSYGDTYRNKDGAGLPTTLSGGNPQVYIISTGTGTSTLINHGFKLI